MSCVWGGISGISRRIKDKGADNRSVEPLLGIRSRLLCVGVVKKGKIPQRLQTKLPNGRSGLANLGDYFITSKTTGIKLSKGDFQLRVKIDRA